MDRDFPELTSFGTLLKFAIALESVAADLTGGAATREGCERYRDQLAGFAKKHRKHETELIRLRQERLNEVVLQPVTGMERETYLPPFELPTDVSKTLQTIATLEETVARFHDDTATVAANMLPGVDRKLRKLASECRRFAAELG